MPGGLEACIAWAATLHEARGRIVHGKLRAAPSANDDTNHDTNNNTNHNTNEGYPRCNP